VKIEQSWIDKHNVLFVPIAEGYFGAVGVILKAEFISNDIEEPLTF
jgi:hypothetical protein